ncbi:MAG: multiprotein bridging factor aMBF1 [Candidatus Nanoarchaeia archaeon]|nr:multiprotein bridging factor aMBF1 [Candidatus Nanoarchaeia archaeon]
MAVCDLCGRESELYKVIVEGSVLEVCQSCSEYGDIIETPKEPAEEIKQKAFVEGNQEETVSEVLVSDFGERIRKARERKGLTQDKLALFLAEKEGTIHRIESGQLRPSDLLIKKLEQFLQISLKEKYKEEKKTGKDDLNFRDSKLTIGDLLGLKK